MEKTNLYRHFDADGKLLYVGISLCAVTRLAEHRGSPWRDEITRIELEWHPSRRHALYAEAVAIRDEGPIHNRMRPLPIPPCEYEADDEEEVVPPASGPWLPLVAKGGERTIGYTVLPDWTGAKERLIRIAASITDSCGFIQSDVGQTRGGFICAMKMAQFPGGRILTDRPDAFAGAHDILAKRGMTVVTRKFPDFPEDADDPIPRGRRKKPKPKPKPPIE